MEICSQSKMIFSSNKSGMYFGIDAVTSIGRFPINMFIVCVE